MGKKEVPRLLPEIKAETFEIVNTPFRHIIIDNFFTDDFYNELCAGFTESRSRGIFEMPGRIGFRKIPNYDGYAANIKPAIAGPFGLFFSLEWNTFVSKLFSITLSLDTLLELHHHKVGSAGGTIHRDFHPTLFKIEPLSNGVNGWYHQCNYFDFKRPSEPGFVKRMRAISIIYYFNNKTWSAGEGGETGFFLDRNKSSLSKKIPPINNRLLLFELNPVSFHSFLGNNESERNSLNQSMHRNIEVRDSKLLI